MRKTDIGVDLTVPVEIVTTNQGTAGELEIYHSYAPQPVANLPTTGVPEGSTGVDTTTPGAPATVIFNGTAWVAG